MRGAPKRYKTAEPRSSASGLQWREMSNWALARKAEGLMSREAILGRIRAAVGAGSPPAPPALLSIKPMDDRVNVFLDSLNRLAVKTFRAPNAVEARGYAESVIASRPHVVADSPYLAALDIRGDCSRELCATAAVGITSAEYALADTGTLVMLSSAEQPRLASLLPPVHVAIIPERAILSGLDELFTRIPRPLDHTSSLVFITGGSRTADIEMILVRGVHGPGEVHVVVVEEDK